MKSKIVGLLLLVLVLIAITMPGQSQKNTSVLKKEKTHKQRVLPIVDFPEKQSTDTKLLAKEKAKALRYDRQSSQPIEEGYMISGRTWSANWATGLPALPFEQSDVVLIGGVLNSDAHLSTDKTGIYSEFDVQIEEVLSDATKSPLNAGGTVYVERFGGAVRFPSGDIQRYETTGQGMPVAGQRYLFFLKRINETDFSIVTGYQLDGQLVWPLDGAVVEEGRGVYPFDVYQGFDVSSFLQMVKLRQSKKSNRFAKNIRLTTSNQRDLQRPRRISRNRKS